MKTILFCWLALCSTVIVAQQKVIGKITDSEDGSPIPFVNIYIANTTIGATSDETGNYSLTIPNNGSYEIVVSHVGYQPFFFKINKPADFHQIDIALEINELAEVVIKAHSNYTKRDVDLFWRTVLGVNPSKKGLEVLNPEKVYFFKNKEYVLKVSCEEPVEIINHMTGYHILYVLQNFQHDYRTNESLFFGQPFFEELIPQNDVQKNRWNKKRKEVYATSFIHFIRALYRNQIHEQGFLLTQKDPSLNKNTVFPANDIIQTDNGQVQVNIESPLYLTCFSKPVTEQMIKHSDEITDRSLKLFPTIQLNSQQITIYPDGTYSGILDIVDNMNRMTGVASMLPVEYDNNSQNVIVGGEGQGLNPFFAMLEKFSENFPQEKVYLHFDNTSYYQGDDIWFKCYTVTSGEHQLSALSKTLYVELLNPGGEIIDKRILKLENGLCHGNFTLNHLPFYSGFYEIRAYTRYMLNFGEDVVFSRLLPVFNRPKTEGNYEEKDMLRYGKYGPAGNYPMKRPGPEKGKNVNLRFFPEGGNTVQGLASRIAFEATDETGNPIDVTGIVMDSDKKEICRFATSHGGEGRGIFNYTSPDNNRKAVAEVTYAGKKYRFDMPAALPQGIMMEVDNLTSQDSIGVTIRRNGQTPAEQLGVAVLTGGALQNAYAVNMTGETIMLQIDKTAFPAGVTQIVVFNSYGTVLCDRLVFTRANDRLYICAKTDKPVYKPYEAVEMEFAVTDGDANPVNTTFSLSVRDRANEVEAHNNILTDLLLMSEIKGYVRNPSWYFEEKNDPAEKLQAASLLDLLLMVQGWRRHSWKQMAGIEPFELKHPAEQGIETNGKVVTFVRQKPRPNVDVSSFVFQRNEDNETVDTAIETFVTDNAGRFSFVSDISGRWNMILSVREKGKSKDHRILIDRVFNPEPRRYRYAEMQVKIAEKHQANTPDEEAIDPIEADDLFFAHLQDSLAKLGIDEKIHRLPEITVKAKRRTREQDIFHNRSTSIAYYDVASEMDDIYDRGKFVGDDIHLMLQNSNKDFSIMHIKQYEFLFYKGKRALFVVNYERTNYNPMDFFRYKTIGLNAIKSIYINENPSVICQYSDPKISCFDVDQIFSCVVFIETLPEGKIPVNSAKGVRKTWLDGYSTVKEFYNPNYAALPPELGADYRRTIYWNPSIPTDENGIAKIQFYNNGSCTNFSINAETITSDSLIGVFKK
jgi:hypothetical protein